MTVFSFWSVLKTEALALTLSILICSCSREKTGNSGNIESKNNRKASTPQAFEGNRPNQIFFNHYFKESFFLIANAQTDDDFIGNYPRFYQDHPDFYLGSSPFSKFLSYLDYARVQNEELEPWMKELAKSLLKIYTRVSSLSADNEQQEIRIKFASAATGYDTARHESHTEGALRGTVSHFDSVLNGQH